MHGETNKNLEEVGTQKHGNTNRCINVLKCACINVMLYYKHILYNKLLQFLEGVSNDELQHTKL